MPILPMTLRPPRFNVGKERTSGADKTLGRKKMGPTFVSAMYL